MKDDEKGEKKGFFTLFKKIKKPSEQTQSDRFEPQRSQEQAPGDINTEEMPGHMRENPSDETFEEGDLPRGGERFGEFEETREKSRIAVDGKAFGENSASRSYAGKSEGSDQEIGTRTPLVPQDGSVIHAVTEDDFGEADDVGYRPLVPQEGVIKVIEDEDSGIRITAVDEEPYSQFRQNSQEPIKASEQTGGQSNGQSTAAREVPLRAAAAEDALAEPSERERKSAEESRPVGCGEESDFMPSSARESERGDWDIKDDVSSNDENAVSQTTEEEKTHAAEVQNAQGSQLTRRQIKERLKEQKKRVKIGFLRRGEASPMTFGGEEETEDRGARTDREQDEKEDGPSDLEASVLKETRAEDATRALHNLQDYGDQEQEENEIRRGHSRTDIAGEEPIPNSAKEEQGRQNVPRAGENVRGEDDTAESADVNATKQSVACARGEDGEIPQTDVQAKRVCIYCGTQAEDDEAEFCSNCGKSLSNTQFCYNCGATIKAGAQFCSRCGSNLEKQKGKKFKRKMGAALKGAGKKIAGAASLAKAGMASDESGNKYILRSFLPALAILTAFFVLLTTGLSFVGLRVEYAPSGFALSATSGFAAIGTLFTGITMLDESFESLIPIRVAGALYLIQLVVLLVYLVYALRNAGKYSKRTVSFNVLFLFLIALFQLAIIVVYAVISARYTQFVASKVGISAIRLSTSSIWAFVFSILLLLAALHMSAKFKPENTVSKTFINWKKAARPVIAISMAVVAVIVAASVLSVTVKPPAEKVWINYVNAINAGDLERGLKTVYREGTASYDEVLRSAALQQQMGFYDGAKVISYYYREEKKSDTYVQATVSVVYRREDRTVKYKYGLHFAKSASDGQWYFMSLPNIATGNIYNADFDL